MRACEAVSKQGERREHGEMSLLLYFSLESYPEGTALIVGEDGGFAHRLESHLRDQHFPCVIWIPAVQVEQGSNEITALTACPFEFPLETAGIRVVFLLADAPRCSCIRGNYFRSADSVQTVAHAFRIRQIRCVGISADPVQRGTLRDAGCFPVLNRETALQIDWPKRLRRK